ncbi:MAG TPA: Gfo/Idh/MocA family oxidoreductase [Planctomycetaceae bacterium]|jgi:predicted dehydrogenase|nr:Gfo/Idh/MocA family oxidoreductase [Planctomycetaceae bacterium]
MSSQAGDPVGAGGSSVAATRIRVGLIGLDRAGQFHAERLSLRSDVEVVAAWEPSLNGAPTRVSGLPGADRPCDSRLEDLLARPDFDRVLIAGPIERRAEWALQAFEAGKHVEIDAPPCCTVRQLGDLVSTASRVCRRLSVLPTRRDGADFRTASQVVRGDQLGRINSARLVSWGKAVPYDSLSDVDLFTIFAYQYVDQVLQLVPGRPRRVFSRLFGPAKSAPATTAFMLAIDFEPGIDALIDVNLESGAVLQTGWMLAGARGGFSGGRIYLQEPSGEISDAPASENHPPAIDIYSEFLASADGELGLTTSAREAEVVMRVLDAARESSRTGQTVSLEF